MTPEEMLAALNDEGDNAGADFNDGLGGWFGWDVIEIRNSASGNLIRHQLSVTFQGADGVTSTQSWTLTPAPFTSKEN
jgi:hypothetical protein